MAENGEPVYKKRKYTKSKQDKGTQDSVPTDCKEVQCETLSAEEVETLKRKLLQLEHNVQNLESSLLSQTFSMDRFCDSDTDIAYYTGFPILTRL